MFYIFTIAEVAPVFTVDSNKDFQHLSGVLIVGSDFEIPSSNFSNSIVVIISDLLRNSIDNESAVWTVVGPFSQPRMYAMMQIDSLS